MSWRNREDIRHNFIHSDIIELEQHLSWWETYKEKINDFIFIILSEDLKNEPVGQISLYNIDMDTSEGEYGRVIIGQNKAKRRGFARNATDLILSWGFDDLKLKRIYLEVFSRNTAAINLYLKCGFRKCGHDDVRGLDIMEIER